MSTFFSDGYQDAVKGFDCSPPNKYVRNDGESTDVYAAEYLAGYATGKAAISSYIQTPKAAQS